MNNRINWEFNILQQLDTYASEYNFPMLNNVYFLYADVRLTTFCSSSEWLIVFEEIAVSTKNSSFVNFITAYGNKLEKLGTQRSIDVISDIPGKSIWDENANFTLNPNNFEVIINNEIRCFTPSQNDYIRAGIDIESDMEEPAKILRWLTFINPSCFFLADEQLLEICGRTNSDLKKFIQLEEWCHPDVADDEMPSENICFQSLARAIAENNTSLYHCPEDRLNTHWSNWKID